jgi:predicted thioesterase
LSQGDCERPGFIQLAAELELECHENASIPVIEVSLDVQVTSVVSSTEVFPLNRRSNCYAVFPDENVSRSLHRPGMKLRKVLDFWDNHEVAIVEEELPTGTNLVGQLVELKVGIIVGSPIGSQASKSINLILLVVKEIVFDHAFHFNVGKLLIITSTVEVLNGIPVTKNVSFNGEAVADGNLKAKCSAKRVLPVCSHAIDDTEARTKGDLEMLSVIYVGKLGLGRNTLSEETKGER